MKLTSKLAISKFLPKLKVFNIQQPSVWRDREVRLTSKLRSEKVPNIVLRSHFWRAPAQLTWLLVLVLVSEELWQWSLCPWNKTGQKEATTNVNHLFNSRL